MNQYSPIETKMANYLYDDMAEEEIVEFERELCADAELSESYRVNKLVKEYLTSKVQLEELKSDPSLAEAERLADLAFGNTHIPDNQTVTDPGKKRRQGRKIYIYSTAIAAAIAILVVFRFVAPFANTDRMFQDYYVPLDASDYSQRGDVNDLYEQLSEGINSYIQGDYQLSNSLFKQMETVYTNQPEVQLFSALTYMGLEQYEPAREILDQYVETNFRYLPEALWYLSLCYLKTGDYDKAGEMLSQLEAYDGMYKEDAQSLVKKLRRIR